MLIGLSCDTIETNSLKLWCPVVAAVYDFNVKTKNETKQ